MRKNGTADTMIMVGIALLVLAGIMIYLSLSSPRVYDRQDDTTASSVSTIQQTQSAASTVPDTTVALVTTAAAGAQTTSASVQYPINLNTATMEELQTINGIGESRAYQIIAYRQQLGAYTSVEQIKDIKGIGDGIYARIAGYLTV